MCLEDSELIAFSMKCFGSNINKLYRQDGKTQMFYIKVDIFVGHDRQTNRRTCGLRSVRATQPFTKGLYIGRSRGLWTVYLIISFNHSYLRTAYKSPTRSIFKKTHKSTEKKKCQRLHSINSYTFIK